jgi:hypothetical protein
LESNQLPSDLKSEALPDELRVSHPVAGKLSDGLASPIEILWYTGQPVTIKGKMQIKNGAVERRPHRVEG